VTVVWQDIIAFRTANSVTVTSGEQHLISVIRYVTCVWLVNLVNCRNYNGVNVQHLQKYLT
jgi:hypothetical protein